MKSKGWFVLSSALVAMIAGYGSLVGLGFADTSVDSVRTLVIKSAAIMLPAVLAAALSAWFRYESRLETVLATGRSALRFALKVVLGALLVYLPLLVVGMFIMVHNSDWLQTGEGWLQAIVTTLPNVIMLALMVWVPAWVVAFVPTLLLQWALCHFVIFRAIKARKQVKK